MKKNLIAAVCAVFMAFCISGCGNGSSTEQNVNAQAQSENKGYYFESSSVKIYANDELETVVEKLGEPSGGTYEAVSCAFEGRDVFYYYDGFTIQSYESSGKRYIYSISLEDDTVKTPEGIKIGDSFSDITGVYGTEYSANGNTYVYTKDGMTLTFIMENDKAAAVTYAIITD